MISEERLKELEYEAEAFGRCPGQPDKERIEMYRKGERYEVGKREVVRKWERGQATTPHEIAETINRSMSLYCIYTDEFVEIMMGIGLIEIDDNTIYLMIPYKPRIPKELR